MKDEAPSTWFEKVFQNEMNKLVKETYEQYEKYRIWPPLFSRLIFLLRTMYKEALKAGFFEMLDVRDKYLVIAAAQGGNQNQMFHRFLIVCHIVRKIVQRVDF